MVSPFLWAHQDDIPHNRLFVIMQAKSVMLCIKPSNFVEQQGTDHIPSHTLQRSHLSGQKGLFWFYYYA